MAIEVAKPSFPKLRVLIWDHLRLEDVARLAHAESYEQSSGYLRAILGLEDDDGKARILVDLFYHAINFAKSRNFAEEQISAFFSILKTTHEAAMSSPFGTEKMYFDYFKELLLRHSIRRPPFSVGLYTPGEAQDILHYVTNTYFRHFKMYKFVFTPIVRLNLSLKYEGMEEEAPPQEAPAPEETNEEAEEAPEEVCEPQQERAELTELGEMIAKQIGPEIESLRRTLEGQVREMENNINKQIESAGGTRNKKAK